MDLNQFINVSKQLGIPSGNYMFKSRKTKIIYWFMVCHGHYDNTLLEIFKPDHRRYEELDQARTLHRALDQKQWHKQIVNFIKSL